MARPKLPRPTDGDVDILKVLWENGPLSVRGIHDKMGASRRGAGYNSILKRIQIMEEKEYIARQPNTRPAIYEPTTSQEAMQRSLIADLVRRVFAGSTSAMVLRALGPTKSSRLELDAIRRHLDAADRKN